MNILLINAEETGGGANRIAESLFHNYLELGHDTHEFVGHKDSKNLRIHELDDIRGRNFGKKFFSQCKQRMLKRNVPLLPRLFYELEYWSEPARVIKKKLGWEDFDYPSSHKIIDDLPWKPDVIHAHNLHSGFFDLRLLDQWSQKIPFMITLHDSWMFTGHCCQSFDCEKWKLGCGQCPYLEYPMQIDRDATSWNLKLKKRIYKNASLFISTPSRWMAKRAEESILQESIKELKVIHNGVNQEIFRPENKEKIRREKSINKNDFIVLFVANGGSKNPWKNYEKFKKIVEALSIIELKQKVCFYIIGEDGIDEEYGSVLLKRVGWIASHSQLVRYYQMADLYLHMSKIDNFPNAIIEALSCALPVLASKVGGIPEQIREGENGFLLTEKNAQDKAVKVILRLMADENLRNEMSSRAYADAKGRYSEARMANEYLNWMDKIRSN